MAEGSVTDLLVGWRGGNEDLLPLLMERVYGDLRRIARARLARERADHTLSPTALVHEMYLRLMDGANIDWNDRAHFFAIASTVMRRVLVDHGRALRRQKRDGLKVPLQERDSTTEGIEVDILDLDSALKEMRQAGFERESDVIHLRYFGGLSIEETAARLDLGESTVRRSFTFAKSWIYRRLVSPGTSHPGNVTPGA